MKDFIIGILLFFFCTSSYAQDIRLAGIEYFNYGKSGLKDAPSNADVSFQEMGMFFTLPTKLKNGKTLLLNGFRYAWVQPTVYEEEKGTTSLNFHSISYSLGIMHRFDSKWTGTLMLLPTLASDFKSPLSSEDFVLQGVITVNKRINEKLLIGGGLAYNTSLGMPLPLPAFQLLYKSGAHKVNILLPALAEYYYTTGSNQKFRIGFKAGLNGARFNYTANDAPSPNGPADKINYSRANAGPVINYMLGKNFQIEAFGGISALRRYRIEDVNGNEIRFDTNTGTFFNIGLSLVLSKKSKKSE